MRRVPIAGLVHEALAVGVHHQGAMCQGHVGDPVPKVELLLGLIENVDHRDGVVLVQGHIHILPAAGSILTYILHLYTLTYFTYILLYSI